LSCLIIAGSLFTYTFRFAANVFTTGTSASEIESASLFVQPFPLGVFPATEHIAENPGVDVFLFENLAITPQERERMGFWDKVERKIVQARWYQQLASSVSRILVIWPGERKEEIADNFGTILRWSAAEKTTFLENIATSSSFTEGAFFPGRYVVSSDATPVVVAQAIEAQFAETVLAHYSPEIEKALPLEQALIVASLLEREAYSFDHMRLISGVIWNRLFIDMPLQIDATLQYVRGSNPDEPWWPVPVPADKFLTSPFNTYQNKGLPPAPIANPGVEALVAALNPYETDCFFYFHNENGEIFCSPTYDEHLTNLRREFSADAK